MTDSSPAIEVRDPATGRIVGRATRHSPDGVRAAIEQARSAQPAWAALGFRVRARALRRLSLRMIRDQTLVDLIASETGKTRFEAEFMEVLYTAELTRFMTGRTARRALRDEFRSPFFFPLKRSRLIYHPRGVVGVIGPCNWPLLNNFADAVPALTAGNAVVLKPSPLAPLTSQRVRDLWIAEGLPDGVLQVVNGDADVGAALVDAADLIFFTGGAAAGRKVAARAGERLIPCVLELGGKNPMVILADADLPQAAHAAVWGGFANSGQACVRMDRIFVEESVAARFVEQVAAEMRTLRQGVSMSASPPDQDLGPPTRPDHIAFLSAQVRNALDQGAEIVVGGKARTIGDATFFEPTLLTGVSTAMDVACEETFGPVLPIITVRDPDEAVALCNALPVGLAASVFSGDRGRALAIARRLQTGNVCINDTLVHYFCVESPLGGWKQSGLGVRHGIEGLRQFCRIETIVEDRPGLGALGALVKRELGFPYRARAARILRWLRGIIYR